MADQDTRLSGRKRAAESQLTPDNCNQVVEEEECNEPMVADAAVLATRKIRKVRRPAGMEDPPETETNRNSDIAKAFAAAPSGGRSSAPLASAFAGTWGAATQPKAAEPAKPAAASGPPVQFGFGTAPAPAKTAATAVEGTAATAAPVSFGFGAAGVAPTGEAKKIDTSAPTTFGFGTKPATTTKPSAPTSGGGSPVGIMAAAKTGSLGSVFGGGSKDSSNPDTPLGTSVAPTGGFSFKVPEGSVVPSTAAPKVQTLPGEGEVTLTTGEEGETTKFTANGKLSERNGNEWAERGVGEMKINQKEGSSRLVMRDAATKRALLNCPLKNATFKIAKCEKNGMIFTVVQADEEGKEAKTHTYLIKIPNTAVPGENQMAEAKGVMEASLQ